MIYDRSIIIEYKILPISSFTSNGVAICIRQFIRICIWSSLSCVGIFFILQYSIICSTYHVTMFPGTLPAIREIIVNLCLTNFSFLCCYQHNAIGSTCTIDRTRCSIFQYLDTLNIIRINEIKTTFNRHTIYNVKRVGIIYSTSTTNTDTCSFTRLTR